MKTIRHNGIDLPTDLDFKDKWYPMGKKFLVFNNERSFIELKTVWGVADNDKTLMTVLWDDGTKELVFFENERRVITYEAKFWRGEIMRQWFYLLNGTKRAFNFPVSDFDREYSPNLGTLSFGCLSCNPDEPEDERLPILPGFIDMDMILHRYPGDPVKTNEVRFATTAHLKASNDLIKFKSFADVLLYLYSSERCTCPKKCDCQDPPPKNWDGKEGVFHTSIMCPEHNELPVPDRDCPIHNEKYSRVYEAVMQKSGVY